jgi:acetate kinase
VVRTLVVNAGSSSLKLSALDEEDVLVGSENVDAPGGRPDEDLLRRAVEQWAPIDAVGHRIVHGGTAFVEPVIVTPAVRDQLEALTDLAPIHQPNSLRALDLVSGLLEGVPAIACFDTAFHATLPPAASTYAVPSEWREKWGVRRFGFHGLSHAYAARRATELLGTSIRVVTCHLGAGASLAAVDRGRSVDTTMGFTPLEGLVMATRSGTVDPGLVLWLQDHERVPPAELGAALEHRSGLLGLAGSADMREVVAADAAGHPDARLAIGVYLHRLRAAVASMAAAMNGIDALVFTGGVGEHASEIRQGATDGLRFLGVAIDPEANRSAVPDVEVTAASAGVRTLVITAREDLEITRSVRSVLQQH